MTDGEVAMLTAASDVLRPPPPMSVSEFAATYRHLKEGTTFKHGLWSNQVFPYLVSIMDAIQEAIETGRPGVVLMKSGQGGGSEAMINALLWLLIYYAGPILYLISKDELASEFSRERFAHANKTCAPVAAKHLSGKGSGDLIRVKRYTDAKLVIQGGRSILNLQSLPYRIVFIDEVDSLQDEVEGHGDPIKVAEIRTDSYPGDTLIVAFAHPTTVDRGAGKLYYGQSDQRRGHVVCVHCSEEFWLQWAHVKICPHEDQTPAQAELDPTAYRYFAPCCGARISDAQRFAMARHTIQKSTLDPEVAKRKAWIGLHFSQLYMSNKPLAFLAEKWIEGLEDESIRRVVVNKRWGDVFFSRVKQTTDSDWRALVAIARHEGDLEAYGLGTAPAWVRFLTGGQDSRMTELHYDIWGWGLRRAAGGLLFLCGALVDYGFVEREWHEDPAELATLDAADLKVFDQLIYQRRFPTTDDRTLRVEQCFHDTGWQPTAVYEYCRLRPRAVAIRGGAEDSASVQPAVRWSKVPPYMINGVLVETNQKLGILNTFTLKSDFFGLVARRFVVEEDDVRRTRLVLPSGVGEDWIAQSASEYLITVKRKQVWKHKGPNHYSDCNVYSYAAAKNLDPFQYGQTQEEAAFEKKLAEANARQARKRPDRRRRPGIRRRY